MLVSAQPFSPTCGLFFQLEHVCVRTGLWSGFSDALQAPALPPDPWLMEGSRPLGAGALDKTCLLLRSVRASVKGAKHPCKERRISVSRCCSSPLLRGLSWVVGLPFIPALASLICSAVVSSSSDVLGVARTDEKAAGPALGNLKVLKGRVERRNVNAEPWWKRCRVLPDHMRCSLFWGAGLEVAGRAETSPCQQGSPWVRVPLGTHVTSKAGGLQEVVLCFHSNLGCPPGCKPTSPGLGGLWPGSGPAFHALSTPGPPACAEAGPRS